MGSSRLYGIYAIDGGDTRVTLYPGRATGSTKEQQELVS